MIDIVKPLHSNEEKMHIDAIHGHTIIELKDVRTGFRDRIESDNVVTDGAESLLRTMGYNINLRLNSNGNYTSYWRILFGGLMLCDDTIPTSSIYKPAGINPVAYGRLYATNSGACTELGTYKSSESSENATHIKQVYDYYTNQGNGTIKSACMLSALGAAAGYGFPTSNKYPENLPSGANAPDYAPSNPIYPVGTSQSSLVWAGGSIIIGDKIYEPQTPLTSGASQIVIKEYNYKPNEIDLLNSNLNLYRGKFIREIKFNLSAVSQNYYIGYVRMSKKFVAIPGSISANTTYPFYVLDIENETITSYNVSVPFTVYSRFGNSLKQESNGDITMFMLATSTASTSKVYKVNLTTNTSTETSLRGSAIADNGSSYEPLSDIYVSTDELYHALYQNGYYSPYNSYIYDPITDKACKTSYSLLNVGTAGMSGVRADARYLSDGDIFLIRRTEGSDSYTLRMYHNPLKLMTINNLPEAVEKTANKTMKVTYELTME